MPSLAVGQAPPSWRRKAAPADSSPPKPTEPSKRPGTKYLKPTGTSSRRRPIPATTRSIIEDETRVLPTVVSAPQPGRWLNRNEMAAAREWLGVINPPDRKKV